MHNGTGILFSCALSGLPPVRARTWAERAVLGQRHSQRCGGFPSVQSIIFKYTGCRMPQIPEEVNHNVVPRVPRATAPRPGMSVPQKKEGGGHHCTKLALSIPDASFLHHHASTTGGVLYYFHIVIDSPLWHPPCFASRNKIRGGFPAGGPGGKRLSKAPGEIRSAGFFIE